MEAKVIGNKTYQGRPCPHGHTERYVSGTSCKECTYQDYLKRSANKIERRAVERRDWAKNKEKRKATKRLWALANPDIVKARDRRRNARRRIGCSSAFARFHQTETDLIYAQRPGELEVDHIIPLQGVGICGLHAAWNLQYLSRSENISKNNHFDPETAIDFTAPGWLT